MCCFPTSVFCSNVYVCQFKAFIHEMLLHALRHTHTLTSYMKVILKNEARAWFNSFHVILSIHTIYWYHYS